MITTLGIIDSKQWDGVDRCNQCHKPLTPEEAVYGDVICYDCAMLRINYLHDKQELQNDTTS